MTFNFITKTQRYYCPGMFREAEKKEGGVVDNVGRGEGVSIGEKKKIKV